MARDSKLHLQIASPCKAPWENMDGDDRVRFCRECNRNVYNLTAMTSREARRVVTEREGRLCVRFYQRTDGTVLTSDCPVGGKRSFLLAGVRAAAAVAGVAAGVTALSACDSTSEQPARMGEPLMGSPPVPGDWDAGTPDTEDLVHPVASAIDSPLPEPPKRVHLMLGSKADWVPVQAGPEDEQYDSYPAKPIADWHAANGYTEAEE